MVRYSKNPLVIVYYRVILLISYSSIIGAIVVHGGARARDRGHDRDCIHDHHGHVHFVYSFFLQST